MPFFLRFAIMICAVVAITTSLSAQESFWKRTNGPFGATVFNTLRLRNGTTLIGTSDGIYSSSNDGVSWKPSGLQSRDVRSICFIDGSELAAIRGSEVYVSMDDGDSWRLRKRFARGVSAFASDGRGTVLVGSDTSLYRSTDAGTTWNWVTGAQTSDASSILFAKNGVVLAGFVARFDYSRFTMCMPIGFSGESEISRSTDNGATWHRSGPRDVQSIVEDSTGMIFAASYDEVLRSTDRGLTWLSVSSPNSPVSAIAAGPCNQLFVALDNRELLVSSNSGKSWENIVRTPTTISSIGFRNCQPPIVGTQGQGVLRYNPVSNGWLPSNQGLRNGSVTALVERSPGEVYALSGGTLFRTTDEGNTWIRAIDSLHQHSGTSVDSRTVDIQSIAVVGHALVAVTSDGFVLRQSSPTQWQIAKEPLPGAVFWFIDPAGSDRLFAMTGDWYPTAEGLMRSDDGGESWQSMSDSKQPYFSSGFHSRFGVDNRGNCYLSTGDGAVRISTPSTTSWREVRPLDSSALNPYIEFELHDTIPFGPSQRPTPLTVSPDFQVAPWGALYLLGGSGRFAVSFDEGSSWVERNGLPDSTSALTFGRQHEVYVKTRHSILRSSNDGESWDSVAPTIQGYEIQALFVSGAGTIYAGTERGGVFVSKTGLPRADSLLNEPSTNSPDLTIFAKPASSSFTNSHESPAAGRHTDRR